MRRAPLCCLVLVLACGRTAIRPVDHVERDLPAGIVKILWRTPLDPRGQLDAHPEQCASGAVAADRLVLGSRAARVVGVDRADGRVLWSTAVSGGIDGEARLDAAHGHVYLGTDDGTLYAIDPAAGRVRWSYKSRGAIDARCEMDADSVFAATAADRVFALEAATGKHRWQYERETPEGFTIHGHAGVRLSGGMLYSGFSDGFLVSLQAPTGEVAWARSLAAASDQFVDVDATPSLLNGLVVASSYSGGLYAVRAPDGEVGWRLGIEGASAISVIDKQLYVAAPRDGLAAITADGHIVWRQGLADAGALTAPVALGPYLLFSGARAGLFVVERASGRLLEVFNPGRGACAPATVDAKSRTAYLLVNSGTLYALAIGN